MVGLAVEDGESDPTGQIEREREREEGMGGDDSVSSRSGEDRLFAVGLKSFSSP
jgi:hypothetical protein